MNPGRLTPRRRLALRVTGVFVYASAAVLGAFALYVLLVLIHGVWRNVCR